MQNKKRKMITMQMIIFELRNVTGNPYVHIFGVGLPVVLAELITMVAVSEVNDPSLRNDSDVGLSGNGDADSYGNDIDGICGLLCTGAG